MRPDEDAIEYDNIRAVKGDGEYKLSGGRD